MDFLIDNSELEGLIEFDELGDLKNEEEFLKLLKTSQLFVPVDFTEDRYIGFDMEGQEISFDVKCLTSDNGLKAVPIFTNLDILKDNGLETSTVALPMTNLASIVIEGNYDVVVINPFTEMSADIPSKDFLEIFRQDYGDMTILDVIRSASVELESTMWLYFRDDDNSMIKNAVDGIYVAEEPMNVNSLDRLTLGYANVLEMPKSSKVLYIGEGWEGANFDMIIAPETKFEYVRKIHDDAHLWKCIAQPFFEDK